MKDPKNLYLWQYFKDYFSEVITRAGTEFSERRSRSVYLKATEEGAGKIIQLDSSENSLKS
jgi:hypothetical protein